MDDFQKERDENTMKNRTMLITAGFGLMMILSLFIGSVGAMAGPVGAPNAPAAGPITAVTITSPVNNSYVASDAQLVSWTVVGGEDNWNLTRIWNETGGWGDWINVTDESSYLFEDLIEGLHYVQLTAFSEYNHMTANKTFTVDTVDPVVVVELPFDEATNQTNFTVSWEYTDETPLFNSSVELTGDVSGFVEIAGSATNILISDITGDVPLVEGVYELNVTVYDSAHNHAFNVIEFSVGPAVQFVTPNEDDPWYTADGNFTIEWTVSIFNGTSIADQDINITNTTTGEYWEIDLGVSERSISVFEVTGFNLSDGNYTVSITVEDNMTFTAEDNEAFAVDTEAPDVEFVVPDGEMDPWYTNDNNFTAEWMYVVDLLGTPIGSQIVTITNGTVNMTGAVDPSELSVSVYEIWGDVLADGNYTIYLNATDIVGNWHNESADFVVDTVAPEFELIVPDEDVDPNYFNDNNFTAEWAIEADPMETPIASILVTIWNGTDSMTLSVDAANTSVNVSDVWGSVLPDGVYTIDVNITDAAGNWYNETVNVVVDTVDPTVDVTYPDEVGNDNEVNATWTVDGTGSPVDSVMLSIVNVTGNHTFGPFDVTGAVNVTLSDLIGSVLADGNWMLSFNVTDMAGNWGITEYNFLVDTVDPIVAITDPSEGSFVNTTAVTISWNAVDPNGALASGIEYLFIRNDTGTWFTLSPSDVSFVLTLSEGPHFVEVQAWDAAGNIFTDSVTFIVDVTLPSVEIVSPDDGAMFSYNEIPIVWTGSDALSGLAYFEVALDDQAWENVGYNLNKTLFFVPDGVHTFSVKAVDNASNENVTSITFTVDITDPWVTITAPLDGLHTNVVDVPMNWTAVDNTTGVAYMHVWNDTGAPVNMTTGDGYLFTGLSEGAHVLHVMVWDLVGNSQEKTVNIVVDLTAPEIVFIHPIWGQYVNDTNVNASWTPMDNLSPIVKNEVALDDGTYIDVGLDQFHVFAAITAGDHTIYVRAWDSAGNSFMEHVFFTVDRTAPTVVSHLPASAAIVMPSAVVKVNFSEVMDHTSVVFTGITGTMTWNAAGNEVTLAHAAFAYATDHSIVVSGKDRAGNAVTSSWTFKVVTQVTGTVNDDKGNPIVNATVKIAQGSTVVQGVTDALGHFALIVDGVGTYNLTISATGFQDLVKTDQAYGVEQNNTLGALAMTPNADYTLLIVGVVVVLAVVLAALFLMRRGKK